MSALYAVATQLVAFTLPVAGAMIASVPFAAIEPNVATAPSVSRIVNAKIARPAIDREPIIVVGAPTMPPTEEPDKNWVCIRQNPFDGRLTLEVRATSNDDVWACEWRAPSRATALR